MASLFANAAASRYFDEGRLVVGGRTTVWVVLGVVVLQGLLPSSVSAQARSRAVRGAVALRQPALPWPQPDVLALGLKAYECASSAGLVAPGLLTIIDYSLPSTSRRLWVIDVAAQRVLFNELWRQSPGDALRTLPANASRLRRRWVQRRPLPLHFCGLWADCRTEPR